MDMTEYNKVSDMTYLEYCDYLQGKYGIGLCDYLEHLFLHILICKYPAADKVPIAKVGIGGVVNFLVPELKDIYSGWEPNVAWKKNCVNKIKDNKDVYLVLLERFIRENKDDTYFEIEKLLRSYNEEYGGWSQKNNSDLNDKIKDIYKNVIQVSCDP